MRAEAKSIAVLRKVLSDTAEEEFNVSQRRLLSGKEIEERLKKLNCRDRKERSSSSRRKKEIEAIRNHRSKTTSKEKLVEEKRSGRRRTVHFSNAHLSCLSASDERPLRSTESSTEKVSCTRSSNTHLPGETLAPVTSVETPKHRTKFERLCSAWPTDAD